MAISDTDSQRFIASTDQDEKAIIVQVEESSRPRGTAPVFVSTVNNDEPVVTRRELWSYYRP